MPSSVCPTSLVNMYPDEFVARYNDAKRYSSAIALVLDMTTRSPA